MLYSQFKYSSTYALPHITWCVPAPLASLPFHAAGIYDPGDPLGSPKTYDFVVSSYTPSVTALLAHVQRAKPPPSEQSSPQSPRILFVSGPRTIDTQLRDRVFDTAAISRHFPSGVTYIEGELSTADAVLDGMAQHEWVHLSCCFASDPCNPLAGAFVFRDEWLGMARLMSKSLECAELAVLPSFQPPSNGSSNRCNELGTAVHLAADMLAAGYKSFVTAIWPAAEADCFFFTETLYSALKQAIGELEAGKLTEAKVAYALHNAVHCLRGQVGEESFAR
jgi:hypothetical protein